MNMLNSSKFKILFFSDIRVREKSGLVIIKFNN